MSLNEAISKRLQELMLERGVTPYQLYKDGGVPKATISQVLNVTRKNIKITTLYDILAAMDVDLGEFFSAPIFKEVTD